MLRAGIIGLWGVSFFLPDFIREVVPGTREEKEWYISFAMLLFNAAGAIGHRSTPDVRALSATL